MGHCALYIVHCTLFFLLCGSMDNLQCTMDNPKHAKDKSAKEFDFKIEIQNVSPSL